MTSSTGSCATSKPVWRLIHSLFFQPHREIDMSYFATLSLMSHDQHWLGPVARSSGLAYCNEPWGWGTCAAALCYSTTRCIPWTMSTF